MFNRKKLLGCLFLVFIFSLVIGTSFASEDFNNSSHMSNENSVSVYGENLVNSGLNENNNFELSNSESTDNLATGNNIFVNPNFEEGDYVDEEFSDYEEKTGNVYGWNVSYIWREPQPSGFIAVADPDDQVNIDSRVLLIMNEAGGNSFHISQFIDVTTVKSISFKYAEYGWTCDVNIYIGDDVVDSFSISDNHVNFETYTIDISDKNYSGVKLFKIAMSKCYGGYIFFDDFDVTYNDKIVPNFDYVPTINGENIDVKFTNKAIGNNINNILWDFGDGTNSTDINPTHTFKSGTYTVTLTVANDNNVANYSQVLSLNFPTIGDKMYATAQDAINSATGDATIEIPNDITEDLTINQNLTLNFNGNKLTGNINVNDGAIVTVTNISDVSSVSTDDSSKLTITGSNIADTNITLNTGNIALDGNEFNGSFITVVNANTIISNNNIANGGIKVNGGKSKIYNNVLSGNDVAITQTEGETNITSNIITDNNIGVNVTNGTANINFNVIYNNNKVALAYVGSVDASNNWFGVFQATFSNAVFDGYVDVYAPNAEQLTWLVLTLNCNETTLSSAQNYTIGVDLTLNSKGENTSSLGTLPKFSLPVSTKLGQASAVNVENSIGEFTLTTTTLTSDDAIFTINGEDYALDVTIFKIEDRINELETQLADAQDNATKLASDLEEANKKVENLTNQLNETQANATKLAENLADANQKADNLTTQLSEAQKQIQTLSVDPISTNIAVNTLSIKALDSGNIQVTLKDANNNLLANKDVQVIINGVVYNGKTGDNGVAKIAVKFSSAGTYYATVSFAGDNTYKSSIGTSKIVVSKKATKITAPKKSFKAKVKTKKVTITLKSGSTVLKSKKITLKVNGKTYTAKTNSKGVATIKVTKLTKKGTFTYTVKFAGDKAYNTITKKGKMTIK